MFFDFTAAGRWRTRLSLSPGETKGLLAEQERTELPHLLLPLRRASEKTREALRITQPDNYQVCLLSTLTLDPLVSLIASLS